MSFSNAVSSGDSIRVTSIPVSVLSERDRFPETYNLIATMVNLTFTVRDLNEIGWAEIWVTPTGVDSSDPCDDSVWIEPEYLERSLNGGSVAQKSLLTFQ